MILCHGQVMIKLHGSSDGRLLHLRKRLWLSSRMFAHPILGVNTYASMTVTSVNTRDCSLTSVPRTFLKEVMLRKYCYLAFVAVDLSCFTWFSKTWASSFTLFHVFVVIMYQFVHGCGGILLRAIQPWPPQAYNLTKIRLRVSQVAETNIRLIMINTIG